MFPKIKRLEDPELLALIRTLPCIACKPGSQVFNTEAHHVTTRGAGGHDVPENLIPLCSQHHHEWHLNTGKMIRKYPSVEHWLLLADREDVLARLLP